MSRWLGGEELAGINDLFPFPQAKGKISKKNGGQKEHDCPWTSVLTPGYLVFPESIPESHPLWAHVW